MRKKSQSNSTTAQILAFKSAASKPIAPPAYLQLPADARPWWNSIVLLKPADEWSEPDLHFVAQLARAHLDCQRLQAEIEQTGDFSEGKLNLRHTLLETLSRRTMALARLLQVHSRARHGETRDQAHNRQLATDTRAVLSREDNLFARPD